MIRQGKVVRMRALLLAVLYAGAATAAVAGSQDAPKGKPTAKREPIVMIGCVSGDAKAGPLTFTDSADGSQYRLTGRSLGRFVGQRVQVIGGPDTRKLRVVGGLTPSPNVAGQAGALDPTRAAVAAAGGGTTGTGSPELPTFRVSRVGAVTGECPR